MQLLEAAHAMTRSSPSEGKPLIDRLLSDRTWAVPLAGLPAAGRVASATRSLCVGRWLTSATCGRCSHSEPQYLRIPGCV